MSQDPERVETVIVGAGQSGLATGYHLQRRGRPFVILEGNSRIGDEWRQRWDSLRLFTPAALSRLPGMPRLGRGWSFATKDEFARYLEDYAERYAFDVRTGTAVDRVERRGDEYLVTAGHAQFLADHVVVATGAHREPRVPGFAAELDPAILQLHSSTYRNPDQLRAGGVLVVGAANSGSEIALELARAGREVWLAGRYPFVFPARPERPPARVAMRLFFFIASRVLTSSTPMGRRARPYIRANAAPLIRVKPNDLAAAGVRRTGRVEGVTEGRPRLADGAVLEVPNVIWSTGFQTDFSWVDIPATATGGEPPHDRGVVRDEPGLYLMGQLFQHALSSTFIAGVGRDADHIARVIAKRVAQRSRVGVPEAVPVGSPRANGHGEPERP